MTEFYSSQTPILVSVDCIIFGLNGNKLSILLSKRRFEPEKGKWSLMGGFVRPEESLDAAAKRVLEELTGLSHEYMEQVGAFGEPDRDPGGRVISVAYFALINFDDHDRLKVMEHDAQWIALDEMPVLGFDHARMIDNALCLMRGKLSREPIGFNLLPKMFTLTQLQQLYETILGEPIDKRNFRKRIADTPCVEKTGRIDKSCSRRGAALYTFNEEAYNRLNRKFKL